MATDIQSEIRPLRTKLEARKNELETDLNEVESALTALDGLLGKSKSAPRRRTRTAGTTGVNRAGEFVAQVKDNPGITVAQAAQKMEMGGKPNYLYRVAGQLASQGKLRKEGAQFYLAENTETTTEEVTEAPVEDAQTSEEVATV